MTEESGQNNTSEPSESEENTPTPWMDRYIYIGIGGFVLTCIVLFFGASWFVPETQPGFPTTNTGEFEKGSVGVWRITVDVGDRHEWVGINFAAGKRLEAMNSADILARRYLIRAPGGAINLGDIPLEEARVDSSAKWEIDKDLRGEVINPAFAKWYSYSYWTHLLDPLPKTVAVRFADGTGVAYVRILSYYCKPEGTGCLTLRYRLESWPQTASE